MEVLLRETVVKLGDRGQIVKVAPGYARNYLFPKRLAVAVTEGNKRQLEIERRNYERRIAEGRSSAEEIQARLNAVELEIGKRASDNGQLFGSVTSIDVARLLNEQGFEIDRRKLEMENIKDLGEFTAKIRLHPEVSAEIKIVVKRVD